MPFSCLGADISFSEVVLQGLDKVTGRLSTKTVEVGQKTTFENLDIYARVCYAKPPEETPENAAFLEIVERKQEGQMKVFSGWMFSSSPALSAMDHAVYDVWVLRCQGEEKEAPKPQPLILENPIELKPVQPKLKIFWQEEVLDAPEKDELLEGAQEAQEALATSETPTEPMSIQEVQERGEGINSLVQEEQDFKIILIKEDFVEEVEKPMASEESGEFGEPLEVQEPPMPQFF